ncbi:unnamed protein product [Anisakis simplex]|uniref:Inner membrane protein n=1 Tax=Anisakis simplex TaxID=6269 RepID=A0A0M3JLS6_ANISI|nr:unnamed protein product [Anisakis simplex]
MALIYSASQHQLQTEFSDRRLVSRMIGIIIASITIIMMLLYWSVSSGNGGVFKMCNRPPPFRRPKISQLDHPLNR